MADGVDLEAELALDARGEGRYRREIGERWNVGDRAFGGYGAALALAASMRAVEMSTVLTSQTVFVRPLGFGTADIDVDVLRRGRSVAVARCQLSQEGQLFVSATSWLSVVPRAHREAVPEPDEPDRNWAGSQWPVLAFAARRGSGYPASPDGFAGEREIELWLRPSTSVDDQLFDVLLLDGHLLDAPLSLLGTINQPMASLDLTISWLPVPAPAAGSWRVLRAAGDVSEGIVSANGSLSWGDGHPYAIASTQAVARR